MSTILKALRRLEEDSPTAARPPPRPIRFPRQTRSPRTSFAIASSPKNLPHKPPPSRNTNPVAPDASH